MTSKSVIEALIEKNIAQRASPEIIVVIELNMLVRTELLSIFIIPHLSSEIIPVERRVLSIAQCSNQSLYSSEMGNGMDKSDA